MYLLYFLIFLSLLAHAKAVDDTKTPITAYDQAVACQNGNGVEQDVIKAFSLFLQSAQSGDPRAEYKVGIAYFTGEGVTKDQIEGLAWMYKAVSLGISKAICSSMEASLGNALSRQARERSGELLQGSRVSSGDTYRAIGDPSHRSVNDAVRSWIGGGDSGNMSEADFERMAVQIREKAVKQDQVYKAVQGFGKYPWHRNIQTALFWIGMKTSEKNASPRGSAWDESWYSHFGGYDTPDPQRRENFMPKGFTPKLNPFYCAMPYNDIQNGTTKDEASTVIPWFADCYESSGKSVLKGRWVAIHYQGRTCFVQVDDCLPLPSDDWEYVFGLNAPRKRKNVNFGLVVSPAVRDYLQLQKNAICDWKFVDPASVPDGPWKYYGDDNTFALLRKGMNLFEYDRNNAKLSPASASYTRPSPPVIPLGN